MKKHSLFLSLSAISFCTAAPITWEAATNTSGKADFLEGTIIAALNGGNTDLVIEGGGVSGMTNYSFAASNYSTINFIATGDDAADVPRAGFGANQYSPLQITTTGDSEFDSLISTVTFAFGDPSGIVTGTMTLEGLTVGTNYQIQLFFNDQRHNGAANSSDLRVMTFGDGGDNSVTVAGGDPALDVQSDHYGQFVIGSFTADAATQEITMDSSMTEGFGNVHYNALLVTGPADINVPPQLADGAFEILDATPADTLVTTLTATDGNQDDTLNYTITAGDPEGVFTLDSDSGELTTTALIDANDGLLYDLTVEVSDGTDTTTATISISIKVPAEGGEITWSVAQNTSSVADLLTGTPVFARNGGTDTLTVGGIAFEPLSIGGTSRAYGGGGIFSTGDVEFDELISTFSFGGGREASELPGGITGLTPGTRYQIQVFFNEQRPAQSGRVMTFGDGAGNTVAVGAGAILGSGEDDDYGQFAIGEFVADGTTQVLELAPENASFGNSHYTAILVTEAGAGADDGRITDINYDPSSDEVTLTWISIPGNTYAIFYSTDLIDFDSDISDSIEASEEETTSSTFTLPGEISGSEKLFFRVERN